MAQEELRIPPQNLEAEQAVLGGMLISPEAIDAALSVLKPVHFYKTAHAQIFRAMSDLNDDGYPIDALTVTEYLKRSNMLEKVGGAYAITGFAECVPSTANIEYYCNLVLDRAHERLTIATCASAIAKIYSGEITVDDVHAGIISIMDKMDPGGYQPFADIIPKAQERIEIVHKEGKIPGISTGFIDLDRILGGASPGDLITLAGRPSMGKTALGLSIVKNMARKGHPAAIASIESGSSELAARLLLQARANDDLTKYQEGFITEEAMEAIRGEAEVLKILPIWIDESGGQSIQQICSRARRLKSQYGIEILLVDYLQLIIGSKQDSRVQEIGEYTRKLKNLAKELHISVLVLSQLSRKPEERANKRPIMADLRECVSGDTLVVLCDGRRVPIRDLVGQTPNMVAMSSNGFLIEAKSKKIWFVGRRPVYDVILASGRKFRGTAEHRLYVPEGWRKISDIKTGDRLAISHFLPEPKDIEIWPDKRVILLGQLIGDGSYLKGQPLRYTTSSDENSRIVKEAAREEFGSIVKYYQRRRTWHQLLISGNGNRWHPAGVNKWFRDLGIFNQRSHEKRIPTAAFRLGNDQIALLLRHLWATDGTIYTKRTDKQGANNMIYYSTNSWGLATDVAALLLRLGIVSRIQTTQKGDFKPNNMIKIPGKKDQLAFLKLVGAFGPRIKQAQKLTNALNKIKANTNVDTLPNEYFKYVRMKMKQKGISHRRMTALRGTSYGGSTHFNFSPSRKTLMEYAEILDDDKLRQQCTNDLFWDKVKDVQLVGEEKVYDLTVPGTASWLADGIVSHNSGDIEQDTDKLLFIYRPEVYGKTKREKTGMYEGRDNTNLAEIIIAKHRNGPTGMVEMTFLKDKAQFFTREQFITDEPGPRAKAPATTKEEPPEDKQESMPLD